MIHIPSFLKLERILLNSNELAIKYIEEKNFEKAAELLNDAITENPEGIKRLLSA